MYYALYYLLKWDLNVRVYVAFLLFNLTIFLSVICSTSRISSRFLSVHFQYCECFVSGPEEEVVALQFKWILFRLVFGLSLSFTTGNMFYFTH
jgi:hypothetical protein